MNKKSLKLNYYHQIYTFLFHQDWWWHTNETVCSSLTVKQGTEEKHISRLRVHVLDSFKLFKFIYMDMTFIYIYTVCIWESRCSYLLVLCIKGDGNWPVLVGTLGTRVQHFQAERHTGHFTPANNVWKLHCDISNNLCWTKSTELRYFSFQSNLYELWCDVTLPRWNVWCLKLCLSLWQQLGSCTRNKLNPINF